MVGCNLNDKQSFIEKFSMENFEDILNEISPYSFKCIRQELLVKILAKIHQPEEKVRYFWIQKLINEYGYDSKRIDINIPAGVGRRRSNVYADIVVYRDCDKTEPIIVGEVKKEKDTDGIDGEQGAGYARNIGAEYHFWSNKLITKYWRTSRFPEKSEPIGNIPMWVGNKPIKNKIPKSEKLPPFRNEVELREIISICHDLIYEKQGHDPAKSFDELTKLLFLKLYDEREVPNYYEFVVLSDDTPKEVAKRLRKLFSDGVASSKYKDVFYSKFNKQLDTSLELDDFTIFKIVQILQGYSLVNTTENIEGADIKGTVFEQMVGNTFRGELAQFFTPREIVDFMVKLVNPSKDDKILDPACGSGGFLIMALRHIKDRLKNEQPNLSESERNLLVKYFAEHNIFGTDINERMARVAKMNMIMHGDGHGGIYNINGLITDTDIPGEVLRNLKDGSFNIIFSNPPFAGREKDKDILTQFELGKNKKGKPISVSKEILFVEEIIRLLDKDGMAGLVLPAGCFNNKTMKPLRKHICENTQIISLIGLPHLSFQVSGANNEGSLIFLKKVDKVPDNYKIFIDWAGEVGFDATGKKINENHLERIIKNWKSPKPYNIINFTELEERIDPWYYHPNYIKIEQAIKKSKYPLKQLSKLLIFSKDFVDKKNNLDKDVIYIETNDVDLIKGEIYANTQTTIGKLPNRAKYILKENDILIPNARDCVRGVAKASKDHEGYIVTNRFFVVRHNEKEADLNYIYYLLRQPEIHYLLKRQATGEINPSIPPENLNKILVPTPSIIKQRQIVNKINNREERIEELKNKIREYEVSISKDIRGEIPDINEPSERAQKLGSEFISFIEIE